MANGEVRSSALTDIFYNDAVREDEELCMAYIRWQKLFKQFPTIFAKAPWMVPPFHSSILYSNIIYYINLFCSFVFYVVTALNAAVLKDISLDIDLIKFAFFFYDTNKQNNTGCIHKSALHMII